jgi:hypothetical protein
MAHEILNHALSLNAPVPPKYTLTLKGTNARINGVKRQIIRDVSPHNMEIYTAPLHGTITTDVKKKKGGGRSNAAVTNMYGKCARR